MKICSPNLIFIILAACCVLPVKLTAKGGGVDFWMEGTVTDLKGLGDQIHFKLKGVFWLVQYRDGSLSPQKIEVDCEKGISVTVHQHDPFFAMTADNWAGGAIQEKGGLLRILKAAVELDRKMKFELLEPKIIFDASQTITLTDASVVRATDADLR